MFRTFHRLKNPARHLASIRSSALVLKDRTRLHVAPLLLLASTHASAEVIHRVSSLPELFLSTAGIGLIGAITFHKKYVLNVQWAEKSRAWPEVQGVVLQSSLGEQTRKQDVAETLDLLYTYQPPESSEPLLGSRLRFGFANEWAFNFLPCLPASKPDAMNGLRPTRWLREGSSLSQFTYVYPPGSPITIRYDPENPSISTIYTDAPPFSDQLSILGPYIGIWIALVIYFCSASYIEEKFLKKLGVTSFDSDSELTHGSMVRIEGVAERYDERRITSRFSGFNIRNEETSFNSGWNMDQPQSEFDPNSFIDASQSINLAGSAPRSTAASVFSSKQVKVTDVTTPFTHESVLCYTVMARRHNSKEDSARLCATGGADGFLIKDKNGRQYFVAAAEAAVARAIDIQKATTVLTVEGTDSELAAIYPVPNPPVQMRVDVAAVKPGQHVTVIGIYTAEESHGLPVIVAPVTAKHHGVGTPKIIDQFGMNRMWNELKITVRNDVTVRSNNAVNSSGIESDETMSFDMGSFQEPSASQNDKYR